MTTSPQRSILGFVLLGLCAACGSSDDDNGASDTNGDAGSSGGGAGNAGGAASANGDPGGGGSSAGNASDGGSSNAGAANGVDVEPLTDYSPCAADSRVGRFSVNLDEDFTSVEGRVSDGVDPARVPDELQASGECRLLTNPDLFCDPACDSGTLCAADGCVAEPAARDLGTVSIDGMVDEIEMTPSGTLAYRNSGSLMHPGFEPGATIVLSSEGGDYAPFTLRGWGISYLETEPDPSLEEGEPMTLTWATVDDTGPARVNITLNVNNHGTTSAWVECDAPDSGSFEIPSDLLAELTALGVSGFPTVVLKRRSVDSTEIEPGCVDLEVVSERSLDVQIPGVVSCTDDEDCDPGTCQPDLTCG